MKDTEEFKKLEAYKMGILVYKNMKKTEKKPKLNKNLYVSTV